MFSVIYCLQQHISACAATKSIKIVKYSEWRSKVKQR